MTSGKSLAILYMNGSYEKDGLIMFLRWLTLRYPSFEIPEETWQSWTQSPLSLDRVTVFLQLAQEQYREGNIDPDVYTGLGVLSYFKGQYNFAID